MTVAHPHVGMVIPVWYPAETAPNLVETLLARTLDGGEQYCPPEHVVLVLDGQARWEGAAQAKAGVRGHRYQFAEEHANNERGYTEPHTPVHEGSGYEPPAATDN